MARSKFDLLTTRQQDGFMTPSWQQQASPAAGAMAPSYDPSSQPGQTFFDQGSAPSNPAAGGSGDVASFMASYAPQPSAPSRTSPDLNTSLYGQQNAPTNRTTSQSQAPRYEDRVAEIQRTTDPTQRGILEDQLARQVFTDLKNAGHDVKWQGNQLMVDGRPYMVNGAGAGAGGGSAGQGTPAASGAPGAAPAGWDAGKWADQGHQTPKYQIGRIAAGGDITTPQGRAAIASQITQIPGVVQLDEDEFQMPDGTIVDIYGDLDRGTPRLQFHIEQPGGAGQGVPTGTTAPTVAGTGAQGATGVDTGALPPRPGPDWVQVGNAWVPPNHPLASQAITAGSASGGTSPGGGRGWSPTAPSYAPGTIDTLDGFDPLTGGGQQVSDAQAQAILDMLAGGGEVDAATEQAVLALLSNPTALDDRTVDMMKAASREETAALAAQEDEALRRFGFANDIDDSRWLASERLSGQRDRNEAIIAGNRAIDIDAAARRKDDERAAIGLGASYAQQQAGREQGAVAAAQAFTALEADNNFRTAALQGDRLSLRESVNQQAAALGQSADSLMLDYTLGLIQDATDRYGIDVAAATDRHGIDTGAAIDREKLAQAGREFQEDLAFRYAQLAQLDAQFGASLGLDTARLQVDANDRARDDQMRAYGL